jgi:hypothetical protein
MFEDYLPELEKLMFNSGIDILSLFAPRHKYYILNMQKVRR